MGASDPGRAADTRQRRPRHRRPDPPARAEPRARRRRDAAAGPRAGHRRLRSLVGAAGRVRLRLLLRQPRPRAGDGRAGGRRPGPRPALVRRAGDPAAGADRAGHPAVARRDARARRRRRDADRRGVRLRGAADRRPERAQRRLPASGAQRRGHGHRGRQRRHLGGGGRARLPARRRPGRDRGGLPRGLDDHQRRLRRPGAARLAGPLPALAAALAVAAAPGAAGRDRRAAHARLRLCRPGDRVPDRRPARRRPVRLGLPHLRAHPVPAGGDHDHAVPAVRRGARHRPGPRRGGSSTWRSTTCCSTSLPALAIVLAGPEPITRLLFGAEFADAAPGAAAADGDVRRGVARLPHRLPDRRLRPAAPLPRGRGRGARLQRRRQPRAGAELRLHGRRLADARHRGAGDGPVDVDGLRAHGRGPDRGAPRPRRARRGGRRTGRVGPQGGRAADGGLGRTGRRRSTPGSSSRWASCARRSCAR